MKKFMLIAIFFFSLKSFAVENQFRSYLEHKVKCNYEAAIDILENRTISLDDPAEIETNLFRISELIKYPELYNRAITAYLNISGNNTIADNPFLKSRLDIFLNRLFLKKGDIDRALRIIDNSGFIKKYTVLLPDNFSGNLSIWSDFTNLTNSIKSFSASADPEGKIDIQDLLGEFYEKTAYLVTSLSVPDSAEYCLAIGKTGHTDIYIDGNKIFSNYSMHGFCHDQYFVKIFLSKGEHNLWVRTGRSKDSSKIALRLTHENGNPVNPAGNLIRHADNSTKNSEKKCSLISTGYFQSLNNYLNQKKNSYNTFNTGYLFYATNLFEKGCGNSEKYFPAADNDELLKSVSLYYLGMIENDSSLKNAMFKISLNAYSENIESMLETAKLKLKHNYLYDAFEITERIKAADPFSAEIHKYRALIFVKSGWHSASLKECKKLEKLGFKSYAHEIENMIYTGENRYKEATTACYNLFRLDKTDSDNFRNLIENSKKAGMYNKADSILTQGVKLFPNNVSLRLKHAELTENTQSPGKALPYILHAKRLSPFNSKVLLKTGLIYHKLNRDETAVQYMRNALLLNADDKWLSDYLSYINNKRKKNINNLNPPLPAEKAILNTESDRPPDLNKTSAKQNSIRQWLVSGPYSKYGPADLDYSFLPEIIDLKEIPGLKKVTLNNSETTLNLKKYNFPEKGIAYAATSFKCRGTVKIIIYCKSAYKLFINSKSAITNYGTGIFNIPQILEVKNTDKISMMIKLYMEIEPDSGLKIIITDANDKRISPEYTPFSNKADNVIFSKEPGFRNPVSDEKYQENEFNSISENMEKAELFLDNDYEAEFEKQINLLLHKYPESYKVYEMAVNYYKTRNIHKAVNILHNALQKIQSPGLYKKLAHLYYKAGTYDEIIKLEKTGDPDLFRKELIDSLIFTRNISKAKKSIFQGLLIKNDPLYNIKLGEISYNNDSDPSMYWEKALSMQPSNFELRDFRSFLKTGRIENPFQKYESNFSYSNLNKNNDNKQNPEHFISRKMIFRFYNDGGSRLFCEDIIQFNNTESLDRYRKYKIPFNGKIHPVKILIHNDGTVTDYHKIINNSGENCICLDSVSEGSTAYISYYIDNPVRPKGLNFFSIPDIAVKKKKESISNFCLKIIAPEDMKFVFKMNRDFQLLSELSEEKNIYSIVLENLSDKKTEDIYLSFSNMKDHADFVMWYSGLIRYEHFLLNKSLHTKFRKSSTVDTIKSVYKYISEEIELTAGDLFSPEDPSYIIKKKKGSSEDKALLALKILERLGVKSYLAFTGKNSELNTDCVFPEIFNRILLYAPLDMTKGLWLDFSRGENKSGNPADDITGKDALILIRNGYEVKKIESTLD